jgi:hypothetical protein
MRDVERFFIGLIEDGTLSVDEQGKIWRHYWTHPTGKRIKLDPPRRAEDRHSKYLRLSTFKDGKSIRATAHRVIYIYIHGDVIDGYEVDHVDTDKMNNAPGNLEKVTGQVNKDRASKNGLLNVPHQRTIPAPRGEDSSRAKLTWDIVRRIRRLLSTHTQQELADMFNVARTNISAIATNRSWVE